MKKVLLIVLMILPLSLYAQVRVVSSPEKERIVEYDSIKNIPGFQIDGFVGQELFLRPLPSYLKKYGYQTIYTLNDNSPNKTHDLIAGHTFVVKKVEKVENTSLFYTIEMEDLETGIMYKYMYSIASQSWPFITLGYKAKYEKENKGKSFVALMDIANDDINNGRTIIKDRGSVWVFQEVISIEKNGDMGYLYTNSTGETIAINDYELDNMKPKSEIDKLKKKYGVQLCNLALKGTIKIGMPKDLVRIAKGEPRTINNASYGDQWIYGEYGDDCVYFKNGKVSGWN